MVSEDNSGAQPDKGTVASLLQRICGKEIGLRVFAVLVAVEIFLMALHAWITWAPSGTFPKRLWRFVHFDREGNLPTWFSSAQLLVLAFLFAAIYLFERYERPLRKTALVWLLCAAGALFLSIDEGAALHEMVGSAMDSIIDDADRGTWIRELRSFPSYYWMLIYVPIALPVAITVIIYLWPKLGVERYAVLAGASCFLIGAVGLDFLEGMFSAPGHKPIPVTLGGETVLFDIFLLEECLEMIGISMILCAFLQHLANRIARFKES